MKSNVRELEAKLVEQAVALASANSMIESMRMQIAREREDFSIQLAQQSECLEITDEDVADLVAPVVGYFEDRILKGSALLRSAEQRANKFYRDFEEAAKWQGFWKRKFERLSRGIDSMPNTTNTRRQATSSPGAESQPGARF